MNLKDHLLKQVLLKDVLQEVKSAVKVYVESDANDYDVYNHNDKRFYNEVKEITEEIKDLIVVEISSDETEIFVVKGE